MHRDSQLKILNQHTCVLLCIRNLVRLRPSSSELSVNQALAVNTTEESHMIGLLSFQIDKYKTWILSADAD